MASSDIGSMPYPSRMLLEDRDDGGAVVDMDPPESAKSEHSIIASSNRGSITYPSRSLPKDTSFPRCHLMARPPNEAEAYSGPLRMLGHGTPLWDVIGKLERPKEHLNTGVCIGDVGFLNSRGNFEFYFNIFFPPEHPLQRHFPRDLVPLDPRSEEVTSNAMYFPPGTALVSKGIETSILSSTPLDIRFTIRAREGGILVLPDGASRQDLCSTTRVRDYVKKHALNWYVYMKELLGDEVVHPNGTLYVVTGTDKASTWANCVTDPRDSKINRLWNPSTITYRGTGKDRSRRITWNVTGKTFSIVES